MTFSPVVRLESVRTVVALAAQQGLKLHQMDVTCAFLNGELEEEIYMKGLKLKAKNILFANYGGVYMASNHLQDAGTLH